MDSEPSTHILRSHKHGWQASRIETLRLQGLILLNAQGVCAAEGFTLTRLQWLHTDHPSQRMCRHGMPGKCISQHLSFMLKLRYSRKRKTGARDYSWTGDIFKSAWEGRSRWWNKLLTSLGLNSRRNTAQCLRSQGTNPSNTDFGSVLFLNENYNTSKLNVTKHIYYD